MLERLGVAKTRIDDCRQFVSLGALLFTVVVTQSQLGSGVTRLLGGVSVSLGLILVIVAGAELFTGNNLLAMAWASRPIGIRDVMSELAARVSWQRAWLPGDGAVRRVGGHRPPGRWRGWDRCRN
jgi:purine-cytosine permease-like protein